MALSDTAIRSAKGKDKPYKLFDEGRLLAIISPSGAKLWRYKYRFEGKEMALALGTYPFTGLKEACRLRDEAKELLEQRIDPSAEKNAKRCQRLEQAVLMG